MKIIVGLGNPGPEYEKTRHNVGFQVIDILRDKLNFEEFKEKKKFNALVSEGIYANPESKKLGELTEKVLLVKSLTFMNLSGESVLSLVNYYEPSLSDLWIIFDDLDFPVGEIKIREKGGPGTHNGMESVINLLKSEEFPRLRIGIESRDPQLKKVFQTRDYVLSKFTQTEEKIMEGIREEAADALLLSLEQGILEAMNRYN